MQESPPDYRYRCECGRKFDIQLFAQAESLVPFEKFEIKALIVYTCPCGVEVDISLP